jgi:hypothetical protein
VFCDVAAYWLRGHIRRPVPSRSRHNALLIFVARNSLNVRSATHGGGEGGAYMSVVIGSYRVFRTGGYFFFNFGIDTW